MNKFVNTLKANDRASAPVKAKRTSRAQTPVKVARTNNGAPTYASSGREIVDLFFKIGASRGTDISLLFKAALDQNEDLAVRVLLWARDARGGAGERQTFKSLFASLVVYGNLSRDKIERIARKVPELGRWDDLFDLLFINSALDEIIVEIVSEGLAAKNRLLAKWLPRDSSRNGRNKQVARFFHSALGLRPREYRELIVGLTEVVETAMSAKDYSKINYSHVPGTATARYRKAFTRNDSERWEAYKNALVKKTDPKVKSNISSGATFPHDLIRMWRAGGSGANRDMDILWDQLPDLEVSSVLPLVDTSSSMNQQVSGGINAMDIAVGLGLYIADKVPGPFNGTFLNFSSNSTLQHLKGNTITERIRHMSGAQWEGSTNLISAARSIVEHAVKNRVSDEDMPDRLLIISDMEFNTNGTYSRTQFTADAFGKVFTSAGYSIPQIVWWNVNNTNTENVPVQAGQDGVAMISGYSVAVAKTALAGKYIDPITTVMNAVVKERYNW